jgi:hypothetical protein
LRLNVSTNFNSSISFITHNYAASQFNALEDVYGGRTVVDITRRKVKMDRVPKCVNYGVYFGISSSA